MSGAIASAFLGVGGALAAMAENRHRDIKAKEYDAFLREYNSPKEQMRRFMEAGINPYGQQYQNVAEANYDPTAFSDSENLRNIGGHLASIQQNMIAERDAQDRHDLAEQQKQIGEETLFSAKTLNDWLNDQQSAITKGLEEDAKGKKIDNAFRASEHNMNLQLLGEDIRNKQTYNKYYGQLLQKELNLKDQQVKQFEQNYEINKNLVLVNQERYSQLINDPKRLYRMVNNALNLEEKGNFYLLESHRIQHMLDTMHEQLLPDTEKAMRAQLAYTLSNANFGTHENEFSDNDWMRWVNYGIDKAKDIANIVIPFGRLGAMKKALDSKQYGNQDYTRTIFSRDGEMLGGYTQTYQHQGTR